MQLGLTPAVLSGLNSQVAELSFHEVKDAFSLCPCLEECVPYSFSLENTFPCTHCKIQLMYAFCFCSSRIQNREGLAWSRCHQYAEVHQQERRPGVHQWRVSAPSYGWNCEYLNVLWLFCKKLRLSLVTSPVGLRVD